MSSPRIYVGTYAKYNDGDIGGKWLDLEDYASKDDFLKAAQELHKDEADPELMFQDYEGFPEKYYSESSVSDELWDWLALSEDERELVEVFVDNVDSDGTLEQARDSFMGKYESERDWAMEFIEDTGGLSEESAAHYLTVSETDARIIGGEEGDNWVENADDSEILKKADKADDYDDEEDEEKKEKILQDAREEAQSLVADEVEEKINKDPIGYFVEDLGAYTIEDLAKANFISIDYNAYARDAGINDVNFVRKDGETWVFSRYY